MEKEEFERQYLNKFTRDPIYSAIKKAHGYSFRKKENPGKLIIHKMKNTLDHNSHSEEVLYEGLKALCDSVEFYFNRCVKLERHGQEIQVIKLDRKSTL